MGCRSAYTRRALGVFGGIRTLYYQGQPKQGPNLKRGLLHPATVHVFKSSPMLGGRLPIKLKSRHRGVVVRDLKGRERAVRGGAEPPPGLKKCSRARQGGRGERHCLLITGYRGVGGTFVNGHRRLYRTHPGPGGLEVHNRALFPMHSRHSLTRRYFSNIGLDSAPTLAVSTLPKGFNTMASSL